MPRVQSDSCCVFRAENQRFVPLNSCTSSTGGALEAERCHNTTQQQTRFVCTKKNDAKTKNYTIICNCPPSTLTWKEVRKSALCDVTKSTYSSLTLLSGEWTQSWPAAGSAPWHHLFCCVIANMQMVKTECRFLQEAANTGLNMMS